MYSALCDSLSPSPIIEILGYILLIYHRAILDPRLRSKILSGLSPFLGPQVELIRSPFLGGAYSYYLEAPDIRYSAFSISGEKSDIYMTVISEVTNKNIVSLALALLALDSRR